MINNIDIIGGCKRILRDLMISNTLDDPIFTFDPITYKEYRIWRLYKYNKRRKDILSISKMGGILTGSKVLSKSYIDGKRILENRNTYYSDWDFLVTEENIFNITHNLRFNQGDGIMTYRLISGVYSSDNQYVDLIMVNDLPDVYKVGRYLYTCPLYIINKKIEIVDKSLVDYDDLRKHRKDLEEFFWKFNYLLT